MRAAGDIQDFEGGVASQRDHLNTWIDDYKDLVEDVEALYRKLNALGLDEERIIVVDLGTESQEVQFIYLDVIGSRAGTVEEIDGA